MNTKKIKQTLLKIFLPWVYYRELGRDLLTEALHPEFGWIWREDEIGGRTVKEAYEQGRKAGLEANIKQLLTVT